MSTNYVYDFSEWNSTEISKTICPCQKTSTTSPTIDPPPESLQNVPFSDDFTYSFSKVPTKTTQIVFARFHAKPLVHVQTFCFSTLIIENHSLLS